MERKLRFKPIRSRHTDKVRVILYGLGSIGSEVARAALKQEGLQVVGAVDKDRAKVGADVGELIGLGEKVGIRVTDQPEELFKATNADLVLHTTGSYFKDVYPQLAEIAEAELDVVSSAEELSFPYLQHPDLAEKLNRLALEKEVTILGTGVNPGFVMDFLPLVMAGVCHDIEQIKVERVVDATTRRGPLQRKIGSGMIPEEFSRLADQGKIGHVGLPQSVALIAYGLGWEIETVRETLDPVISEDDIKTPHVQVKRGQVAGIRQRAVGIKDGQEKIVLDLEMRLKASDPHDAIFIAGRPQMSLRIEGGTAGDQATVAALINAIPKVVAARPGLLTAVDLPVRV